MRVSRQVYKIYCITFNKLLSPFQQLHHTGLPLFYLLKMLLVTLGTDLWWWLPAVKWVYLFHRTHPVIHFWSCTSKPFIQDWWPLGNGNCASSCLLLTVADWKRPKEQGRWEKKYILSQVMSLSLSRWSIIIWFFPLGLHKRFVSWALQNICIWSKQ